MRARSGTTSADAILAHALAILDGTLELPKARSSRAAAVLARQALEDAVQALCREAGANLARASMRSRLLVLRMVLGDSVADTAEAAWAGLSRACHHHAYELAPTESEVRHLIELVAVLCAREGAEGAIASRPARHPT
jgi:hypothetical protein